MDDGDGPEAEDTHPKVPANKKVFHELLANLRTGPAVFFCLWFREANERIDIRAKTMDGSPGATIPIPFPRQQRVAVARMKLVHQDLHQGRCSLSTRSSQDETLHGSR
jgi:hypothetical protein